MGRIKINPDRVEKVCPTCNMVFSVSYYLRNKRTYCSKKCSNNSPDVISKMVESQKETFEKRYGMHPMKTEQTKENLKRSVKEKHGVDWISKKDGWYDTVKRNNLEKYGTEHYNNIEKIESTCIDRYGVPNYRMTEEYKKKYRATCLSKYGVPHASMSKEFKIEHTKTMFEKFMSHPNFINFHPEFGPDDYKGTSAGPYLFKCKRCNTLKECSITNGKFPICPSCDKNNCSSFQNEVYEYVKSILGNDVVINLNDRTLISPKELDIVIPSKNIAIECDGVLWHSEIFGHKNKIYHVNKTNICFYKGYKLIHIFDNEWRTKRDIVKSVLSSMLETSSKSVYGRKCTVREISSRVCCDFLNNNHLQGADHSSVKLGLFDEHNELLSVMTFMKSRFDKNIEYEMGRFCNKLGIHIAGGASKLFKYFLKTYRPISIVSYNDRRYFNGNVYINLGFTFIKNTSPNCYYIIDNYQTIQNRLSWQKHKLKDKLDVYDDTISAWDNMKNNGYDRIWDSGNGKWVWTIH